MLDLKNNLLFSIQFVVGAISLQLMKHAMVHGPWTEDNLNDVDYILFVKGQEPFTFKIDIDPKVLLEHQVHVETALGDTLPDGPKVLVDQDVHVETVLGVRTKA